MKYLVKYIEHKSSVHTDRDDAWIARVWPSNSGRTLYFNGMALKRCSGFDCNHFDAVTGEEFWVSGVKKSGSNRHWAGGGTVFIERSLLDWYDNHVQHNDFNGLTEIDDLPKPDIQELSRHENQKDAEQDA